MRLLLTCSALVSVLSFAALPATAQPKDAVYSWRYYRTGNTGLQGDTCEAISITPNGDPWIAGYDPGFEEGGLSKFVQSENRWINVSNIDYEVIGHPEKTGTARISDISVAADGTFWMGTGRGALKFNPSAGPKSLVRYGADNSPIMGGWTTGVDLSPDGRVWFSAYGTVWGAQGLARFDPTTNTWQKFSTRGGGALAVQPKPGGGYYVYTDNLSTGFPCRYDSTTQSWTEFTENTGQPGHVIGRHPTDAAGNTWMYRLRSNFLGDVAIDCRRPDGSWIGIPPLPSGGTGLDALRAFGDRQALAVENGGKVWRFNGATWTDLGVWAPSYYTYDVDIDAMGNVWACGIGGAAKRNAVTGIWQRHRITNNAMTDNFNYDVSLAPSGLVYSTANAGPGVGGMMSFDGQRWTGFNQLTYGLGQEWPFLTDNSQSLCARSNGKVAVNPTYGGVHEFDGSTWKNLGGPSTVVQMTEDSLGRLWALGEYFDLRVHNGTAWTSVGMISWGTMLKKDPDRAGTVWASTLHEVKRTDGTYTFSRTIDDFPQLTSQSDTFSGIAVARDGVAWVGCTVMLGAGGTGGGLIKLDSKTGAYTMIRFSSGWPIPGKYVTPLAVTPDGKVWMVYTTDYQYFNGGLCWYDGTNVGVFPGPVDGVPQWGGLPHTQIRDMEVRNVPGGYELWMSCASRGIAVLKVRYPKPLTTHVRR